MMNKKAKTNAQRRNWVAKHAAGYQRTQCFKDRKKATQRGYQRFTRDLKLTQGDAKAA